jgi:signal transduction histidine kinase/CheY-like chemotaxis protein
MGAMLTAGLKVAESVVDSLSEVSARPAAAAPPSTALPAPLQSAPARSVRERERLRQHLICFVLLELAGVAYTTAYLAYELYGFSLITVGGMALGAVVPFAVRRGHVLLSANAATAALFLVILTTSWGSGGVSQPGYAWIFIVPLVAGLLGGLRCLAVWAPMALAGTLAMYAGGIGPFEVSMILPEDLAASQGVFDIGLVFATVTLIVATFLRTRTLAERETLTVVADLERAEGEARKADQAKSAFLATMSHEIRTPMNGVLGMTDLLLEMPLGEQQRRFAEVIKSSGESLLSILNDILDYSKIEAGRLELESTAFDIRALVEQAVELIAARGQEQRLAFIVDVDPATPARVVGDAGRLRQVLMNLLGNAVKFTAKGEVEITLQVEAKNERQAGDGVRLSLAVRDTGIGIAPEALARLFTPFSQADSTIARQYGGTGLGLAISARLVELMGGRIAAESVVGHGSTFTLSVPFGCPADQPARQQPLAGRCVLVVDSHPRRRAALTRHVAGLGAVVVTSLRDAGQAGAFDAALIVREADDGLALASQMASGHSATRVVLLVEWGAFVDEDVLRRLRIAGQVSLPGSSTALLEAIDGRPQANAASPVAAAPAASVPEVPSSAPLVLIVDDNVVNRRIALHQLTRLGYRVIEAENGRDAIAQVAAASPAAVLMDIEMPVMDGYEATRHLRETERGRRVPVIALTAHAMAGYRERVLQAGMDDYLTKPLRRDELGATLRRVLPTAS